MGVSLDTTFRDNFIDGGVGVRSATTQNSSAEQRSQSLMDGLTYRFKESSDPPPRETRLQPHQGSPWRGSRQKP